MMMSADLHTLPSCQPHDTLSSEDQPMMNMETTPDTSYPPFLMRLWWELERTWKGKEGRERKRDVDGSEDARESEIY